MQGWIYGSLVSTLLFSSKSTFWKQVTLKVSCSTSFSLTIQSLRPTDWKYFKGDQEPLLIFSRTVQEYVGSRPAPCLCGLQEMSLYMIKLGTHSTNAHKITHSMKTCKITHSMSAFKITHSTKVHKISECWTSSMGWSHQCHFLLTVPGSVGQD